MLGQFLPHPELHCLQVFSVVVGQASALLKLRWRNVLPDVSIATSKLIAIGLRAATAASFVASLEPDIVRPMTSRNSSLLLPMLRATTRTREDRHAPGPDSGISTREFDALHGLDRKRTLEKFG